jgi:hypothetical protein
MPKRTIKTAIGTYINKAGVSDYGFQGEEIEVHPDHVARFDEFNVENGDGEPAVPPREAVSMVSPGAGAETSGTASGLNTAVTEKDAAETTAGDDTGESKRGTRKK